MLNRLKALSRAAVAMLVLGCMAPLAAQGQESRITWRISQPAGNASEFSTQQEAVEAFKTLPVPPGVPAEFQYLWESVKTIKSKSVSFGGAVSITYWIGIYPPTDPDWSYNSVFETEAEAIADFTQGDANPFCPGESFVRRVLGEISFQAWRAAFKHVPASLRKWMVGIPNYSPVLPIRRSLIFHECGGNSVQMN